MATLVTRYARPRLLLAALAASAVLAGAAGCGPGTATSAAASSAQPGAPIVIDDPTPSLFDGVVLGNALAKPAITLTDTGGQPYNLVQRTAGKLTLVYFGYTHCPDVCPTTMADLAATLRQLTPAQRARIDVVFITTDPNRDTPAALGAWLGQFSSGFVGLTGPFPVIQKAAASLGIAIQAPVALPGGGYTVTHGAEVLAFNTDGKAHVVYTAGETVAQYVHDIPLLLAGRDLSSP
jgi:protein SCO1